MKHRIFLGGTCATSTWRNEMIPFLEVDFFNPVVTEWNEDCQAIEEEEKETFCNIHFYCITHEMEGVFSIAEVVDSVHNNHKKTILQLMPKGFDPKMWKSLEAVGKLISQRGGKVIIDNDIQSATQYLNSSFH